MSEIQSKVMVVDDDESVRDSLRKLLDDEGYVKPWIDLCSTTPGLHGRGRIAPAENLMNGL